MKALLTIGLWAILCSAAAQNTALFEEANASYNEGKYEEAIAGYLKILERGEHSAALYYNLGNACYKLNRIAPSIYYYEKARLLDPNDADIKNNLLFAQQMTIDAIETVPKPLFSKLAGSSIGRLSYNSWALVAVAAMFLFVAGFLLYYFSARHYIKRSFFALSAIFLLLCTLSFGFAYYQYQQGKNQRPAIIFEKEISVRTEPNTRSEVVFLLHEGTRVNVEEEMEGWKKIRLSDGKTGWLPEETLKEVKDF